MIKILLNNQKKIFINTLKTGRNSNYISYVISFIIIAVLLYFLTMGVWRFSDQITTPILNNLLAYGLLIVTILIVLLGTPQVFKHLYAATDLGLLFTLPIPTRYIFWVKYLQSLIGVPFFCFLFFIIPLVTYGITAGANLLFYPVAIFVLLAIIIIGVSITYLFNLILIQIVPASKANEVMTVMNMLAGAFGYLVYMIPNLTSDGNLMEQLSAGLPLFPAWMPVRWGSEALIQAMNGSFRFLLPFVFIILLAILGMAITASLVEKGFRTGWIRLSEGGNKRKKGTKRETTHRTHHPVIAIAKKEGYAIRRDMREWLVFMPLFFFVIFPIIGFISSGAKLSDIRGFHEISWPIAQGFLFFIYAILNGQIAASSIAREGKSIWILRTLPLSGKHIAYGKLLISWLIPLILLTVIEIILGIVLGWTLRQLIVGIVIKAIVTVGISAIGLFFGTTGAKYNPANPMQRLKFGTAMLLTLLSYVYLFVALIPFGIVLVPTDVGTIASEISQGAGFWGMIGGMVAKLLLWKAANPVLMTSISTIVVFIFSFGVGALLTSASAWRIENGIEIDLVNESNSKALFKSRKAGGSLY
jgi:ABC-2 type transport system permease protein